MALLLVARLYASAAAFAYHQPAFTATFLSRPLNSVHGGGGSIGSSSVKHFRATMTTQEGFESYDGGDYKVFVGRVS